MHISHPALTSPIYELLKVFEVDLQLDNNSWTIRIELFRDTTKQDHYRSRIWQSEFFRLAPTFPQDERGEPTDLSDDILLVERPFSHEPLDERGFSAPSVTAAIELVLENLRAWLEQVTGIRPA